MKPKSDRSVLPIDRLGLSDILASRPAILALFLGEMKYLSKVLLPFNAKLSEDIP